MKDDTVKKCHHLPVTTKVRASMDMSRIWGCFNGKRGRWHPRNISTYGASHLRHHHRLHHRRRIVQRGNACKGCQVALLTVSHARAKFQIREIPILKSACATHLAWMRAPLPTRPHHRPTWVAAHPMRQTDAWTLAYLQI